MPIKAEGMAQFDIFHVFVEQLKKQVPVNLKNVFDPSLERS
jgi:hypothetical protein